MIVRLTGTDEVWLRYSVVPRLFSSSQIRHSTSPAFRAKAWAGLRAQVLPYTYVHGQTQDMRYFTHKVVRPQVFERHMYVKINNSNNVDNYVVIILISMLLMFIIIITDSREISQQPGGTYSYVPLHVAMALTPYKTAPPGPLARSFSRVLLVIHNSVKGSLKPIQNPLKISIE